MNTVSTTHKSEAILSELIEIVGADNVTKEECDLICYEKDYSLSPTSVHFIPDFAVHPETTEQVAKIVKSANKHKMLIVPRGGGTGMWGGTIPINGGIVLDMRKMDRIIDVDEEKRAVTVQAGVLVRNLAIHLKKHGFFVADNPESWFAATVGARTQGNGTGYYYNSRYGQFIDQIICLEVVLPSGEVIKTGPTKVYDPASGYDMTRLFSGAEGTLGVITEVTLRMYKLPEHRIVRIIEFPSYEDAISAVMAIRDSGLVPETVETVDGTIYLNYLQHLDASASTSEQISKNSGAMIIGYAGVNKLAESQMELTQEICKRFRGRVAPYHYVETWTAFKETYPTNPFPVYTALMKKPIKYVLDATVPLESTAEIVKAHHSLMDKYKIEPHGIVAVHCAPDLHSVVYAQAYVDERDEDEIKRVQKIADEMYNHVRSVGGGIGGAGGIGLMRRQYGEEQCASMLNLMKRLKQLLDPNNIMNPGKKFKEA